jgi:colanic acid/amylovoran biosynthesis glycosyltransferase
LKIAYFINDYPRVSHSFIRREIQALERCGIEVQRIALRGWKGALPDPDDRVERQRTRYVLRAGIAGLMLPTLRTLLRSPARFFAALRLAVTMAGDSERPLPYHLIYLAEACRLLRWLQAGGARRVHAHFGTNSAEVVMLARALGGPPYSFTVHGPAEFVRPMKLDVKVQRASFVVAISQFGRSQVYLRSRYEDWPRVKVIHCGLDKAFYDVAPVPIPAAPRLVCVGRLSAAKGQLLLVEAVALLAARGVECELVLAGEGPMRAELEALIARHDLHHRVHITGWIGSAEVRQHILAARALVLPSFAEGLPVVIMEAMALRRPVLATYIAGIPELVRPYQDGWLFPAGSVDELARAMQECLTMPLEMLERIGAAAHDRVVSRHAVDTEAGKLAELFRSADPPV